MLSEYRVERLRGQNVAILTINQQVVNREVAPRLRMQLEAMENDIIWILVGTIKLGSLGGRVRSLPIDAKVT